MTCGCLIPSWSRTGGAVLAWPLSSSGFIRGGKALTEFPQGLREGGTRGAHLRADGRLSLREHLDDVLKPLIGAAEAAFVLCEEERDVDLSEFIPDRLGLLSDCLERRRHKLHVGESLHHLLGGVLVDPAARVIWAMP